MAVLRVGRWFAALSWHVKVWAAASDGGAIPGFRDQARRSPETNAIMLVPSMIRTD